jgi:hypothetical protein
MIKFFSRKLKRGKRMFKKWSREVKGFVLGFVLVFALSGTVVVASPTLREIAFGVRVNYNGTPVNFDADSQPFIMSGRTFLPVRAIADLVGLHVDFVDGVVHLSDTPIPARPAATPTPPATQSGMPTLGTWSGNTYTNQYFGFRVVIPNDWSVETPEDLRMYAGVGFDAFDIQVTDQMWDAMDTNMIYDMLASSRRGANMSLVYERLPAASRGISTEAYLRNVDLVMSSLGLARDRSISGTRRIGNHDWAMTGTIASVDLGVLGNVDIHMRQFINVQHGYVATLTIGYAAGTESLDELLAMIQNL